VDLGYARKHNELVPVVAANDAEVSFAFGRNGHYAVSLEHSGSWCTHYAGLDKLAVIATLPRVRRRQRVRAGEVIGYTSGKLGFELFQWTDDLGFVAVDARPHLAQWDGAPALVDSTLKEAA
jgi:murein DD-endopeptidase MepM/ murein hydrolase activator NlpD